MTPFARIVFVAEPGNVSHDVLIANAKGAGFSGFAIRLQHGEERVNEQKGMQLRDAARAAGMYAAAWIGLELGEPFDMQEAGRTAAGLAPHVDGLMLNAEARTAGSLLAFLPYIPMSEPLAWSSLPTFVAGEVVRQLDNRKAWLCQQAYSLENEHTPLSCRNWALGGSYGGTTYPPLSVGWWYRATVLGRSVRGLITGQDELGYKFKENRNTWGLQPFTRTIFNRKTGKGVGSLSGLWSPARWAPTLRTTPMSDGRALTGIELAEQVRAAQGPPCGIYLGETTPQDVWDNYRP